MNRGTVAHKSAEISVRAKAVESIRRGGPPDLRSASRDLTKISTQDLLETPEVSVSLAVEGLKLNGKADGLLRNKGIVIAIERKPRSAMFKRPTTLQAMVYAVGGCLLFKKEQGCSGAHWQVTG